ncbi:MAG: methyltransferase domain-containing protein [Acidobacteriota bacterium]
MKSPRPTPRSGEHGAPWSADRYAPWSAAESLHRDERRRLAARDLHRLGRFPRAGDACLELGFGALGWAGDLIGWGLRVADLHGIELDAERAALARAALPAADLRVGDARSLPWPDGTFRLVIASTLLTSIRQPTDRQRIADEATRVLAPDGALLVYDFRWPSPRNRTVRRLGGRELRALFSTLEGRIRSLTLAPPLARLVAPVLPRAATLLGGVPPLRSHLLAVLHRP